MKKIIYLAAALCMPLIGFSQTPQVNSATAAHNMGQTHLPSINSLDIENVSFKDIDGMYKHYYDSLIQIGQTNFLNEEGGEYTQWQRWRKKWLTRLPIGGDFEDYFDMKRAGSTYPMQGNAESSTLWEELGPRDDQRDYFGTHNSTTKGNIGPLEFISFYEANPNYMLTGSTLGGIFYSTDGGVSWNKGGSDTQWDLSGCSSATFKKNNAGVWFAAASAIGDNNAPEPIGTNNAIYRTFDFGATWTSIAKGGVDLFESTKIYKIIVLEGATSSDNDDVLMVATSNGLLRSVGNIYTGSVLYIDVQPGLIYDIEERPDGNSGQNLFATVKDKTTSEWTIKKSTDYGLTWVNISSVYFSGIWDGSYFPQNLKTAEWITIEMTKAADNKLFCIIDLSVGRTPTYFSELWVYDENTGLWENSARRSDICVSLGDGNGFGVSPHDEDDLMFSNWVNMMQSTTGGVTVTNVTNSAWGSGNYHMDVEDIVYHPTIVNEVWISTHGGLSKSTNNGITFDPSSEEIGVAMVWGMSISEDEPNKISIGLYHDHNIVTDASIPYPTTGWYNPDWDFVRWGDGQKTLIDKTSSKIWASAQGTDRYYEYNYDGVYSSNYSINHTGAGMEHYISQNKANPEFIYTNHNHTPSLTDLVRDKNLGGNTEQISDFSHSNYSYLGVTGYVAHRFYTTSLDGNYIYLSLIAGHPKWDGHIFRTTSALDVNPSNIQTSWEEIVLKPDGINVKPDWVLDIEISHVDQNVIFVAQKTDNDIPTQNTGEKMVYRIDCNNMSSLIYTDITYNLPKTDISHECLALEKGTNEGLYIATSKGVFYTNKTRIENLSIPDASKWIVVGSGLPHTEARGLEINYTINKLRLGTNGRGVWEHELECPTDFDMYLSGSSSSDAYWEVENKIESTRSYSSNPSVTYRAGQKILLKTGFNYNITSSNKFKAFIHGCSQPGNSFREGVPIVENSRGEELISNKEESVSVKIYPNPNRGQFNIDLGLGENKAIVEVFDLMGKKVYTQHHVDGAITVDIIDQPRGIYLIKITIGEKVINEKIIYQ